MQHVAPRLYTSEDESLQGGLQSSAADNQGWAVAHPPVNGRSDRNKRVVLQLLDLHTGSQEHELVVRTPSKSISHLLLQAVSSLVSQRMYQALTATCCYLCRR